MKYKIITTPQGKMIVDESAEIKEGDAYVHTAVEHNFPKERYYNICICHKPYRKIDGGTEYFVDGMFAKDCFKIVVSIDFSLDKDIPMVIVEEEVDVAANNNFKNSKFSSEAYKELAYLDFKSGYKAAQQKGVYSEEQLRKAFQCGQQWVHDVNHDIEPENLNQFIEFQKQDNIELEMKAECCKKYTSCNTNCRYDKDTVWKIKTTRIDGQLMAYIKH